MKYFSLFILLLIFYSCNSQNENSLYVINPEKFSEDIFTLSDIANDIKYIPLENTFPIGGTYSIRIIKNGIFLSAQNTGVIQFDRKGKYLSTIGSKGRGPGEYLYGNYFTVDENSKRIYIIDKYKIMVYTFEGKFLRDIPFEKYTYTNPREILMNGPYLFLPFSGSDGDLKYNWIILDTLGNMVSKKQRFYHPSQFVIPGFTYKFENKLFYGNFLNDTIFSVSTDLKAKAAYLFSQGVYRWPKEGLAVNLIREKMPDYFRPFSMFESKNFIFLRYGYHDKEAILLIDKKTKRTYQAFKPDKDGFLKYTASIKNDLDGGLPLTLNSRGYYYFVENGSEYIAVLINPFELKNDVASDEFKNSIPKFPEKKKQLEQLANNMDENDNPVLMLVKLKE